MQYNIIAVLININILIYGKDILFKVILCDKNNSSL